VPVLRGAVQTLTKYEAVLMDLTYWLT